MVKPLTCPAVRMSTPSQSGFTLVEMLIALTIMAVMAGLSWQGLDAMSKSRQQNQVYQDQVLTLTTNLAQWGTDLDAVLAYAPLNALEFDGQLLRMTRRSAVHDAASEGMVVVAYAQRPGANASTTQGGDWLRWQSAPASSAAQLQIRWAQAKAWYEALASGQTEPGVRLAQLQHWRVITSDNGAWQTSTPRAMSSVPEAIRLELDVSPGQAFSGTVRRDWIRPSAGGTR